MDATDATGSYAGAMGRPQFMPSSYRAYAVDSSADGKRDIWTDWSDVIGSVANYFVRHGWKTKLQVVAQANLSKQWRGDLPENTLKPEETVTSLSHQGVLFATDLPGDHKSQLLTLNGDGGMEHWVGFHNFFVITRYNRSVMYALAVHQLGREIAIEVGRGPSSSTVPINLPDDPIPRDEPRSRYGNGPYYRVYGATYAVLDSNYGYQERGVASWYGKKFHGQPTANQETYNMYGMTAAHKSLPLPSYVRVRNLRNGKSIIVRVNDRGPFVDNRLIDLSYAAAMKLDMITDGTSLVEVTAISFDKSPAQSVATVATAETPESPETAETAAAAKMVETAETVIAEQPAEVPAETVFLQVGAFGEPENARRRFNQIRDVGIDKAFVHEDTSTSPALYRVRIGPIADVHQYDSIVEQLQSNGISETHLVTE
jgi:rare lipoprotein A